MKRNLLTTLVFILLVSKMTTAQKFVNRIYAPPAIRNTTTFNISIDTSHHNFNPNGGTDVTNASIPTFCYNQMDSNNISYLGPTLFWPQGQQITINAFNNMPQRTTMHFHGLNLPSNMDGGPHEIIESKSMWDMPVVPRFTVIDPVQTVWYHSHLMDSTTMQVAMGLAGMIILESPTDSVNLKLPRDYGVNDFPVVVQEKSFNIDTTVTPNRVSSMKATSHPGPGNYLMVNGLLNGFMHIPSEVVRLRFLNGSPISSLNLCVNDSVAPVNNQNDNMWLVATDGGYTPKAYPFKSFIIAPGERMEMLLNCTNKKQGDTVYLRSLANAVPSDIISFPTTTPPFAFMALVIDTALNPTHPITTIPDSLESYPILDTLTAYRRAPKRLYGAGNGGNQAGPIWTIDSMPMNMDIMNDTILVGRTEIWTIENKTNKSHPFHIHKVQFQVLDITDALGNKQSVYNNTLPKHLMGYKDDVLIRAGTTLRFITQFDHYGDTLVNNEIDMMNGFMYHCHILTHEDSSMMHQFVVLDTASYNKVMGTHIGVKENTVTEKANLAFYPNPAGNVLNIKGYTAGKGTIRFMDVLGRTIKEEKVAAINGNTSIQVDDLPRGFVFVEYVSGNTRMVQKILLQ